MPAGARALVSAAPLVTVDRKQSGVASAVLTTTRQVGSVIGVALFGSLIADRDRFVPGMHLGLYISIAAVLIGALSAFMAVPTMSLRSRVRRVCAAAPTKPLDPES